MVTIKTSFFPEARGARGEGGVEKVKSDEGKKKSEIPAISPRATRGTFVPFFFLHWFGVETCIRGNQGLRHFFFFFRAVQPEFKKIFMK